ncbi:NAD(P)/FAD-dependent oxidoreductase [Tabrizicola sp.]|uniref:NAD(P)/FAD-dependent oxidoreductase n=1 Tax=Tabrizicola sp. TaxID=2005166 RepID=UPI003F34539D
MQPTSVRPKVIIVGGGFAGIAAAKGLAGAPVDVLLIDRLNHSLFQPLLYQVATSALGPSHIAQPIRHILRRAKNVSVHWDEVTGIDRSARRIHTLSGQQLPFDFLVIATGATHSYFGRDDWAKHAPGLKSIEDAFVLRGRILGAFERAEMQPIGPERDAQLEFVIVGAGPTGVELAGALAELARHSLARDFRSVSSHCAKIKLVEAGPRILPNFNEKLAKAAHRSLEQLGVDILTGSRVTEIEAGRVRLGDREVASETVIWAAGVKASPAARWLDVEPDQVGRVPVDKHLRIAEDQRIFVIGDTAAHRPEGSERPLPGVAPVAKQMGSHVAKVIKATVLGRPDPAPFRYRQWGNLATIGRNKAIADFGRVRFSGFPAWAIWSLVHVALLSGTLSRASVVLSWVWSYLTWERGARIILSAAEPAQEKETNA